MEQTYAEAGTDTYADADMHEYVQEALLPAGPDEPSTPAAKPAVKDPRRHDGAPARCGSGARSLAPEIRPRERLLAAGSEALSSAELLGILFASKVNDKDALDLASAVISEGGGLVGLSRASYHELLEMRGMGKARVCMLLAAVELGRRLCVARNPGRPTISSPADVHALLGATLAHQDREHFVVCMLDTKNQVIGSPTVSIGTLSSSLVHPREVFKPAIRASAASVILAHNHPSGDVRPSREDRDVTKRLADAGQTIGIEVLDHVVVGDGYFSMKEHGML